MVERYYITPGTGIKIKWSNPTDLRELYRQMKLWLEDNGFVSEPSLEKKYVEAIKPSGKDTYILWNAGKDISDYFSYRINVEFIFIAMQDVEIQGEGFKRKLTRGTLQINIIAYIEYGKKWESLGTLAKVYHRMIAKSRLEDHVQDLYNETYKFQKMIKDFIGLSV